MTTLVLIELPDSVTLAETLEESFEVLVATLEDPVTSDPRLRNVPDPATLALCSVSSCWKGLSGAGLGR